jgi:hypothetical protein
VIVLKKKRRYKPKALTRAQQDFVVAYEKNAGNINRTCQELNITTGRAAAIMQNPLVKERLSRSVEVAKERLTTAAPHLVNLALELVNDDEVSVKVRATLLANLLDRAGVSAPKEPAVQININTQIADRARQLLAEKVGKGAVQPTLVVEATDPTNA